MVKAGLAVLMIDQLAIQGAENLEKLVDLLWEEVGRKEEVEKIQHGLEGRLWDVPSEVEDKEAADGIRQRDWRACKYLVVSHEDVGEGGVLL